jgi:hypothetical protein
MTMEITFHLSDEIIHELRQIPNTDNFVGMVLKNALLDKSICHHPHTSPLSKWGKIAQRIEDYPLALDGYSTELKEDIHEFRENFSFGQERDYELSPFL